MTTYVVVDPSSAFTTYDTGEVKSLAVLPAGLRDS